MDFMNKIWTPTRPFLEDVRDAFLICTPCFLVAIGMDMVWDSSLSPRSVRVLEAAISLISFPALFVLVACSLLGQALAILGAAVAGGATRQTRKPGCIAQLSLCVSLSFAHAAEKFHLATAFLIGTITALVVALIFGLRISGDSFSDWQGLGSGLFVLFVFGGFQVFARQKLLAKASSATTARGRLALAGFCFIFAIAVLIAANSAATQQTANSGTANGASQNEKNASGKAPDAFRR